MEAGAFFFVFFVFLFVSFVLGGGVLSVLKSCFLIVTKRDGNDGKKTNKQALAREQAEAAAKQAKMEEEIKQALIVQQQQKKIKQQELVRNLLRKTITRRDDLLYILRTQPPVSVRRYLW